MALSRHHIAFGRPLGISEIVSQAQDYEFSTARSMQAWLRSAQMLLTEAAICEQDGDLQKAYLYLLRHADLILSKIPTCVDYKKASVAQKAQLSDARKAVQKNLAKLEQWKPKISQNYERYTQAVQRRDAENQRVEAEREDDFGFGDSGQVIDANEHRQLAVDLAHREIQRRHATRQDLGKRLSQHPADGEDVSQSVQSIGRRLNEQSHQADRQIRQRDYQVHNDNLPTQTYNYPSVPAKESSMNWNMLAIQPSSTKPLAYQPPSLPPKQSLAQTTPSIPPKGQAVIAPSPELEQKYVFQPSAFTENGTPLRTLLLPPDLRKAFLSLASQNTNRNLETCGILCGTVISNALFINHLIVPSQTATSDTCDTTEEGDNELFDYCDSHDLLVCGWIHTHPTQTCFLSSRDLHTSAGYQIMLPEAIAIVCAPSQNPDWGIFRLTDPPGLPHVLACEKKGLFHPHSESHLYTDALKPGHVVEGPGLRFQVVDLRK
ncbi:Hypothetical protein R9X50_00705300 [Acrodontium crateriforme]|uniref:MPN domain-containing protein n=1 Tax=Acrodontium crateriforme TaxID=150365 RepID=A0AAQ3MAC6_9PEZI|nr:Hypothetical protein R9X50_00705300 [Acrodontium crateriforme]